jgi:DNA transformation protein and related proteins
MSDFVTHVLELMHPWAPVTARRMFGGHGLYRDGLMFALEADDTLYVKVDAGSASQFVACGCRPFVYTGGGRAVQMSYWTVPPECTESPAEMARWCDLGWQAALRAQHAKSVSPGARRSVGQGRGHAEKGKGKAAANTARKAARKTAMPRPAPLVPPKRRSRNGSDT